jgi:hypothetical protein
MYSSTLSSTSSLDGGGWLTPRLGRFTPGEDPVTIVHEAGLAPWPVWTVRKVSPLPGFDTRTVQLVARRYIEYTVSKIYS